MSPIKIIEIPGLENQDRYVPICRIGMSESLYMDSVGNLVCRAEGFDKGTGCKTTEIPAFDAEGNAYVVSACPDEYAHSSLFKMNEPLFVAARKAAMVEKTFMVVSDATGVAPSREDCAALVDDLLASKVYCNSICLELNPR